MSEMSDRTTSRLEPVTGWTIVTESPLKGLAFAREAGRVLAWDEGNQLYLLNSQGETLSYSRVPQKIVAGAISDEGSLIALLGEGDDPGLVLLNADFDVTFERTAPSESSFLTIDHHGRYIAVGSRLGAVNFVNRYGRAAGRLETIQPVAHLCFLADQPFLVGAAAFGMLVGVEVLGSQSSGRLDPEIVWQDRLMSNVGRLTANGDGAMILASCFTHGIQRFDLKGRNEGSYHLGGTVSHAVPDFPGRTIVAATLEGELVIMNSAGNVRGELSSPGRPSHSRLTRWAATSFTGIPRARSSDWTCLDLVRRSNGGKCGLREGGERPQDAWGTANSNRFGATPRLGGSGRPDGRPGGDRRTRGDRRSTMRGVLHQSPAARTVHDRW